MGQKYANNLYGPEVLLVSTFTCGYIQYVRPNTCSSEYHKDSDESVIYCITSQRLQTKLDFPDYNQTIFDILYITLLISVNNFGYTLAFINV